MPKPDQEQAEIAWLAYKKTMRHHPSRQLRKREFIAGYFVGVQAERDHTREYVTPMNLKLYGLVRDMDENPELVTFIKRTIPETVKRLVTFLETGVLPKEKK